MMMIDTTPSRRGVLAGLGGMAFCIAVGSDGVRLMSQAQANALANAPINPWVRIAPDGKITILSAGAEMGQGSMTSLPLIVAEEMDADWSKVAIEWTPADANIYGYKKSVRHRAIDVDRRQPRSAALFHPAPHGRRPGAQGADRQRRAEVGRRRRNAQDRAERRGQSCEWSAAHLWRDRRVRHNSRDTTGGRSQRAERAQGFSPDRQVGAAARHAVEGQRHGAIRHRREIAGHGLRLDLALARAQCAARYLGSGQAGPVRGCAGELERRRGQGDERRDRGGQACQRPRRRCRSFRDRRALEGYVKIHADPTAQAVKLEEKGDVSAA